MRQLKYLLLGSALILGMSLKAQQTGAIKVELVQQDGKWQLLRGGEPYYVNGVGGKDYLDQAVAYGANSLRTWSPDGAQEILDEAHSKGMTVLMGLWVGQERQGFDYDDPKAVKAQLEGFREVVKTYKDHPALLMWGIGNENDLFYSNFKVWNAIEDLASMIHELDPNHPTMTVTAGLDVAEVQLIKERAPSIDIYGVNTYAGLLGVGKELRQFGWEGPYMITEWGPNGHWEVPKTAWEAPIEQTSSQKAAYYQLRYEKGIAEDDEMCIGSYVFLWGHKQETTGTWYGVFLEDGTETEVMDVLEYVWTGEWPKNRAPHINSFTMNGKHVEESVYTQQGDVCTIKIDAYDPDNDKLEYRWELLPESTDIRSGGDAEAKPEAIAFKTVKDENGTLQFRAPLKKGPYRMFLYIYDGNGNAATVNIPFYVKGDS
ncbi:glycoside hydrolase family 2 TIM barrel-domain containing protein [Lewinella sp. LCG006]|uniref:glycoside hydrolase family 2 TIM barrel-domain containing protein n=1 Tax=Lewinella sp. LCG006 TaxID=3231911 RepID=UPI00345FD631